MKRREFIGLLGGAAAWPLIGRAQSGDVPVVGYLNSAREQQYVHLTAAFRKGLADGGFAEGRNVAVDYRWAEGDYSRLPALAADLVKRNVAVIVAHAPPAARVVKAATGTIPVVFTSGEDPVRTGLVASINRPGGNVTGVSLVVSFLLTKRMEMLRKLLPDTTVMVTLLNPNLPQSVVDREEAKQAARSLGIEMHVLEAASDPELDKAFAFIAERRARALVVCADPFFNTRRAKLVALSAQHKIATMYPFREFAEAEGLMSYGPTLAFAYHASGLYVARILKGEKPAELPVQQPSKFEFVINLKTATALGFEYPATLLALADEVIE
jgi:putative tryptophan/tyrosine transport system substrate-binding protein